MKTILFFEGLSGAGKSTTIEGYRELNMSKNESLQIYDREFGDDNRMDCLYNDFSRIQLSDYLITCTKLTRIGLFLNNVILSNHSIYLFDRGLLNIYVEAKVNEIPTELLSPYLDEFMRALSNCNVCTVVLEKNIDLANRRVKEKLNKKIMDKSLIGKAKEFEIFKAGERIRRNMQQLDYYTNFAYLKDLKFIDKVYYIDGTLDQANRAQKVNEIINTIPNKRAC